MQLYVDQRPNGDGAALAVTPEGLYGWGNNWSDQLSIPLFRDSLVLFPQAVTLHEKWAVAKYQKNLPPRKKHELVKLISFTHGRTILVTQVGTYMAGLAMLWFIGNCTYNPRIFMPVPLPDGFVAKRIDDEGCLVVVSMGSNQLITGRNNHGQLGLGHNDEVCQFTPLPFWFDRLLHESPKFFVFQSGAMILIAGQAPRCMVESGLLPGCGDGSNVYTTATPLLFRGEVSRYHSDYDSSVVWVTEGQTNVWTSRLGKLTLAFEATHFSFTRTKDCFCDNAGGWHRVKGGGGWSDVDCKKPPAPSIVEIPRPDFE
ncbi:hypothetical protein J8273_7758 [Carpediemonas membranifera]|uniref:Uncharacterized protein n=1 Tax=Carpediemonas membranifera TaxID=201153 RepID=A0A8J6AWZ5_9EUKA|nr:hypothetical protein J8273_7758 [Carpediemonas membranifera]|eukprot:KAG9390408.1 hypothetical protein J8273_7758 [Carpediemonas membranifera]